MKKFWKMVMVLGVVAVLPGCSVTLNLLSNNNVLTTRSQATASGEQEGLVEGGGSPVVSPTVTGI
jgi:hypothetical protein